MQDRVIQALEGTRGVDDWLLREVRTESTQYYLAREQPESERTVETTALEVEVYNDHPARQGGAPSRGSAMMTLVPGDEGRIRERVQQAVSMAGLTDNPPYTLPGPQFYPEVLIADRLLSAEPARAADRLTDELRAAVGREKGIALASAEVFIDRRRTELRNSRGIRAEQEGTSLLLDFVLLARDSSGHETEAHLDVRRRALGTLDLPALVAQQARFARDTLRARLPATGRFAVIVNDQATRELLSGGFMSPFAFRSDARLKYQGLTPWEVGRSIFGEAPASGDPLTVHANAILPWGTRSARFDGEGLPGQRLPIIENGILQRFWATQRYADYLKVPATGEFGNLEIAPGSLAFADMWEPDGVLYEIVAFSSMSPDPFTGSFVGEIRLGYERRGGEIAPIKGGSVSGNLFADLATARLSQEAIFLGDYLGPQAVRFPALDVGGQT